MKKMIIALAVGAAAISTPLIAQAPGGQRGWGGRDQTREEAKQRADMIFQMIDSNRDGVVTREEAEQALAQFQASRGNSEGGSRGGMMQRMIDQMFANSPSLTLQQFEAQALARFDAQDLNHDGIVTAEERRQARERAGAAPGTSTPPPASPGALPAPPPPQ
jgi:hypothetical protein